MVNVGQNWRLDCNKSRHSAAELVPGRSIDTVSFCGWAPCFFLFFALCCLGKIPGGAPFSQLHKSGNGGRVDRP